MEHKKETDLRIKNRLTRSILDVNTQLEHFTIISYKVAIEKIEHLIPKPFKIWTFKELGKQYALVSAVAFKDKDFSFYKISRLLKFKFFQTNFRTYIIDKRDNSHSAWFFGTTLGSITSIIPKNLWNMPWEYGKYKFNFKRNNNLYSEYKMEFKSKLGNGLIEIESSGDDVKLLKGFKDMDEQTHILTHPVIGYYDLSKKELGTYEIWHPKINLKEGKSSKLYFELFEELGFLTKSEMNNPHSVLITPKIEFDILLPPRKIKIVGNKVEK
ncbi:DUF2071 domain-containing protein [Tenacibaculum piscium]|uniref:DUF2071 domain-containing protein n=1 Tax=Tenacibaculum piscium TaxID=1458515 RepID=UPI00187B3FA3|nr:DUF2071 domain-containing protein [Tenacibaculum piscium]MBE7690773.1 DUF2071 domain-containing protein [Tenacibaculum piscium]